MLIPQYLGISNLLLVLWYRALTLPTWNYKQWKRWPAVDGPKEGGARTAVSEEGKHGRYCM